MTTTTAPALAEGVTYADAWLYVQEAAPDLIATWQSARAAYDRHESGYQAGAVAWQRRAGAIRRRPRSEYAEALAIGTVNDASASTTSFVITLTGDTVDATDDHYNGRIITFTSGVLLQQSTDITDYNGTTKAVTVTALTEAPGNGDPFVIS